jgi:hypothetical protein
MPWLEQQRGDRHRYKAKNCDSISFLENGVVVKGYGNRSDWNVQKTTEHPAGVFGVWIRFGF